MRYSLCFDKASERRFRWELIKAHIEILAFGIYIKHLQQTVPNKETE